MRRLIVSGNRQAGPRIAVARHCGRRRCAGTDQPRLVAPGLPPPVTRVRYREIGRVIPKAPGVAGAGGDSVPPAFVSIADTSGFSQKAQTPAPKTSNTAAMMNGACHDP